MSSSLFNKQMTSNQAREALFRAIDGKTPAEVEKVKAEYSEVLPVILERECKLAAQGWLID